MKDVVNAFLGTGKNGTMGRQCKKSGTSPVKDGKEERGGEKEKKKIKQKCSTERGGCVAV